MPYIPKERRGWFQSSAELINHPGDLNYVLTRAVLNFLGENPNYERYNAAIGALECCKLELYRRMVVPYEDGKIAENGDVYPTTTLQVKMDGEELLAELIAEDSDPAKALAGKLTDYFMRRGQFTGAR